MKRSPLEWSLLSLLVVGGLYFGWWLVNDAARSGTNTAANDTPGNTRSVRLYDPVDAASKDGPRNPSKSRRSLEDILLGVLNERLIRFDNEEDYRKFLASLKGSKFKLLGKIDQLRVARIGFGDAADLDDLLNEDNQFTNYIVELPTLPEVGAQAGALGFGDQLLSWLGVRGDNSSWGEGITIAILDTGVGAHRSLPDNIQQIDLVSDGEATAVNGHGTAVASLIVGQDGVTSGIAPAANLISIRIGNENGESNSFLLAEGIIAAVDAGAQLLNISMGSYGDSVIVRDAVSYALEHNTLIFAASGNEGLDSPSYPAAYEGVYAVGAVDAKSDYMAFSNLGSSLDAPGYGINAAWADDQYTLFSGTSASAPIVTAAVAATATELDISLLRAYEVVNANLNEAGAPGNDPAYGDGVLNLGRSIDSTTPGIYDAAAASHYYVPATDTDPTPSLLFTFENRGTETLVNTPVSITLPSGTYSYNIASLQPGAIRTFTTPIYFTASTESISVSSSVVLGGDFTDSNRTNNELATQITLITPEPEESP